jgi:hypothetical protein
LSFSVGHEGLDSLSFGDQLLVAGPEDGELQFHDQLQIHEPTSVSPGPSALSPQCLAKGNVQEIDLEFSWGRAACAYRKRGNQILMKVQVTNNSAQSLKDLSARLMKLTFPATPIGGTLEAGMFGYGFKGEMNPLTNSWPLTVYPQFAAPVIQIDYGQGALSFCSEDLATPIRVSAPANPPPATNYALEILCGTLEAGGSKSFDVSLRFGATGATIAKLSGDILQNYRRKYPFKVKWKDRRPIGMIYLASSGIKEPDNPRRWIMNLGKIDVRTDQGKAEFRDALLALADRSVKILKATKAQGMITWDPEGQEFAESVYYGDPRQTPVLAPEMEFKGDGAAAAIDEYFAKFRRAGFRVGVCIRPQRITMVQGKPRHQETDNEQAVQALKDKVAYAKERWGCTLFYVDTTTAGKRPLNPDVFKEVAQNYPDVLFIPENESMRYFAYSAPLNSYFHNNITSTPAGARALYPQAFSALMAPAGDKPEHHGELVAAVRRGDILLFNGWYGDPALDKIRRIYQEAAQ